MSTLDEAWNGTGSDTGAESIEDADQLAPVSGAPRSVADDDACGGGAVMTAAGPALTQAVACERARNVAQALAGMRVGK